MKDDTCMRFSDEYDPSHCWVQDGNDRKMLDHDEDNIPEHW